MTVNATLAMRQEAPLTPAPAGTEKIIGHIGGEVKERPRWRPAKSILLGEKPGQVIGVAGETGAGKSHLVYQLINDKDFGPEETFVIAAERSESTYGQPVPGIGVKTFEDAEKVVKEFGAAYDRGERLPKVGVIDSVSAIGFLMQQYYEANPIMTKERGDKESSRNKLAEYSGIGDGFNSLMVTLRNLGLPMTWVVLVRTHEPQPGILELSIPGKMIPRDFTGQTDLCLHLKTVPGYIDPASADFAALNNPPPHIVAGRNEFGTMTGEFVKRLFYTQHVGEFKGKPHRLLNFVEAAHLPTVLRKLEAGRKG